MEELFKFLQRLSSIVGHGKGFVCRIRESQPDIVATHCFFASRVAGCKIFLADLAVVLKILVNIIQFFRTKFLESHMFAILCKEMGAEHTNLLHHTEI